MKLISLLFLSLSLLFFTHIVSADVPIKEFTDAQCPLGEKMVSCSNGRNWYGQSGPDQCEDYRLNPGYRRLVVQTNRGPISGDHSEEKYCLMGGSLLELITYHGVNSGRLLFITLIIEIILFWLFKFRGARFILTVLFVNIITVILFYLISLALPFRNFYILILLELGVILIESYFIRKYNPEFTFRNILIFTFLINAVSAILGNSINSGF